MDILPHLSTDSIIILNRYLSHPISREKLTAQIKAGKQLKQTFTVLSFLFQQQMIYNRIDIMGFIRIINETFDKLAEHTVLEIFKIQFR